MSVILWFYRHPIPYFFTIYANQVTLLKHTNKQQTLPQTPRRIQEPLIKLTLTPLPCNPKPYHPNLHRHLHARHHHHHHQGQKYHEKAKLVDEEPLDVLTLRQRNRSTSTPGPQATPRPAPPNTARETPVFHQGLAKTRVSCITSDSKYINRHA